MHVTLWVWPVDTHIHTQTHTCKSSVNLPFSFLSCRVFRRMLFDEPQQSNIAHGGSKKKKRAPVKTLSEAFIEKYDFRGQPTVVIQDFDPEVFKQLMEYIHTGVVALQSRTLLGLMNAADHYGLEELKLASIQFLERAINTDTVCSLLSSAEKYIQYKSTKILVQKMLDYVDHHAEVVLSQSAFASLPQHVVRLVLGREELQACEESKFEAAFRWCVRYVGDNTELDLKTAFEPFVSQIEFHKIPVKHLMQRVKAAEVVDDAIILTALAYQADPTSVDTKKLNVRFRRVSSNSTLDGGQPPGPTHDYFQSGFRRVQSLGVVKSSPQPEDSSDSTDGEKHSRGGSVPPPDLRTDAHPSRVFEIRAESQASELSLSSADSTNSLSSVPHSPTMGRSTSSSSYSNVSAETADSHKLSNASENFITMSSNSVEV